MVATTTTTTSLAPDQEAPTSLSVLLNNRSDRLFGASNRSERLVGASNSSERLVGASNKQGKINQEPLLLLFKAPKRRSASRLLLLTGARGLSATLEQEQEARSL
jgi:hypothetical protein